MQKIDHVRQWEETVSAKSRTEDSADTKPDGASILDFQTPWLGEINVCCLGTLIGGILSWRPQQLIHRLNGFSKALALQ